jgi:hypothetical protein
MPHLATLPPIRPFLGLALLVAFAPAAPAQTFFGLTGGFNVSQGPSAFGQSYSQGFTSQALVGRRLASHFRVRLETLVSHFTSASTLFYAYPNVPSCLHCNPGPPAPGFPVGTVGVAELGASEIMDLIPAPPGGVGIYLIAGGGAYYLYQHPTAEGTLRFGLSGGAGLELRLRGTSAVFLEARYHALVNAPSDPRWLVPISVGVRF